MDNVLIITNSDFNQAVVSIDANQGIAFLVQFKVLVRIKRWTVYSLKVVTNLLVLDPCRPICS